MVLSAAIVYVQSARKLAEVLPEYCEKNSHRPQTLTHGDIRADNLAFTATSKGGGVTVFDWQVARRASGPRDLAYFRRARSQLINDARRKSRC